MKLTDQLLWSWKQSRRKCLYFCLIFLINGVVLAEDIENKMKDLAVVDAKLTMILTEEERSLRIDATLDPPQSTCDLLVELSPVCHFNQKGNLINRKQYRGISMLSEISTVFSLPRGILMLDYLLDSNAIGLFVQQIEIQAQFTCLNFNTLLRGSVKLRTLSGRGHLLDTCLSYRGFILRRIAPRHIDTCKSPYKAVTLLPAVVPLTGHEDSFVKKLTDMVIPDAANPYFEMPKIARFTLAFWIYLDGPCNDNGCNIVIRRTETLYLTPVIIFNRKGSIHVQFHMVNGENVAFLTDKPTPINQWVQMTLVVEGFKAELYVASYIPKSLMHHYTFSCPSAIEFDPLVGFWTFGGFWNSVGARGFLGHVHLYPFDSRTPYKMQLIWNDSLKKSKLELDSDLRLCSSFKQHLRTAAKVAAEQLAYDTCSVSYSFSSTNNTQMCYQKLKIPGDMKNDWLRESKALSSHLKKELMKARSKIRIALGDFEPLAMSLQRKALHLMSDLTSNISDAVSFLRASGCLGNGKSYFVLASMYSVGFRNISVPDPNLNQKYHLLAALRGYSLSRMALATKHTIGPEGYNRDCSLAAGYLRNSAFVSKKLVEEENSGVQTHLEMINLKDAEKFANQRGQDSDAYSWLSYQASMGSADAMVKLGHMLFHGQHGVVQDRPQGIKYFAQAANRSDPGALYTLGVIYLRGLSVDKNMTQAMKLLTKSASLNFSQADNSLGYVEWIIRKNLTEAIEHFKRAADRNDTDGLFHYGSMHDPSYGEPIELDMDLAFDCYKQAASKGHKAACMKVGEAMMTGIRLNYSCHEAVSFLQFVSHQHPEIGRYLRNGIDSYLRGDFEISFINYLMAAESGVALAGYNSAYSCEEMPVLNKSLAVNCQLHFHNFSAQLNWSESITRMGDFYWYGNNVEKNKSKAAELYCRSCGRDATPMALFNVAYLIEHGFPISGLVFNEIRDGGIVKGNKSLARSLYWSCVESPINGFEGSVPCLLAWLKLTAELFVFQNPYSPLVLSLTVILATSILVFTWTSGDDMS